MIYYILNYISKEKNETKIYYSICIVMRSITSFYCVDSSF